MIVEPSELVLSRYSPQPYGKEGGGKEEDREQRLIDVHGYILSGSRISGQHYQKKRKHTSN